MDGMMHVKKGNTEEFMPSRNGGDDVKNAKNSRDIPCDRKNVNIKNYILMLIIFFIIFITSGKTLALSNNRSYTDTPIIINKTDEQKLVTAHPSVTLTAEQEKQIQESEEQKKRINSSLIHFSNNYTISKSSGIEQNINIGSEYYVLQFYSPLSTINPKTLAELEKSRIILEDYIPDNAFYAKIPQNAFESLKSLIDDKKIRYVGPIPPEAKVSEDFLAEFQRNPEASYKVVVHLFEEPTRTQLNIIKEYLKIHSYSNVTYFVYGEAKGSSISKIYNFNFVKLIEQETPLELLTNYVANGKINNTYLVIFREWTLENKEKVLSMEGVRYVKNTIFTEKEYPAIIIISLNQSIIDKIKEFNFIYDVQPVVIAPDSMPKNKEITNSPIILIIIIILFCCYVRRGEMK